ncbi:MAG: ComEC/Rec2 family competence protein [Pseudomonadota bacterium]
MKRIFLLSLMGLGLGIRLVQNQPGKEEVFFRNPASLSDFFTNPNFLRLSKATQAPVVFRKRLLAKTFKTPHFSSFQLALWQGDLSGLPFWLLQKYREQGLLQVLALSGQHVWALALCLGCLGGVLWKKWWIRKLKMPLAAGILLSLAPSESSVKRTVLCVGLIYFLQWSPLVIQKGYGMCLGLMFFLMGYPQLVFDRGFQLSLLGILGVWIVNHCFSTKQKVWALFWLACWFFPVMSLFFGKWVGDSFLIQWGMGWVWDQIFLPLLFLSGIIVLFSPVPLAEFLAQICEKTLTRWLNWEALHVQKSGISIYRPTELEMLLVLGWLVALACWNLKKCQNVPKKDAYGATCIDLTRSAHGQ